MTLANLIADRLRLPATFGQEESRYGGCDERGSYGLGRLGLATPKHAAPEDQAPKPPSLYKKKTFKLPTEIADRLKALSAASGQFQYAIVTEAIRQHLGDADEPIAPHEPTSVEEPPQAQDPHDETEQLPADPCRDQQSPPEPTTARPGTCCLKVIAGGIRKAFWRNRPA